MGHRDDLLVTRQYTRMTNAAGGPPTRSVCLLGFVQVPVTEMRGRAKAVVCCGAGPDAPATGSGTIRGHIAIYSAVGTYAALSRDRRSRWRRAAAILHSLIRQLRQSGPGDGNLDIEQSR